jgi:hypothetical protein
MPVVSRSGVQCGHFLVIGECLSERQVDRLVWCMVRRYAPRLRYFELVDVEDARHGDAPNLELRRQAGTSAELKPTLSNFFEISRGPQRASARQNQSTEPT